MPSNPKYCDLLLREVLCCDFGFSLDFFKLPLLIPLYVCMWQWGWPTPQFLKWLQVKPFHFAKILTPTSTNSFPAINSARMFSPHKFVFILQSYHCCFLRVVHPLSPRAVGALVTFHFFLICSFCPAMHLRGRESASQGALLLYGQLRGIGGIGDWEGQTASLFHTWGM